MVVLRDSSLNSAFDWVGHIYIDPWLHLVIHCCWCFIPPPFSTCFLCENKNNTNNTCWIKCQSQLVLSTAGSQQILTKFQLSFGCVFGVQLFTNSVFIFFDLQVQNSTKYVLTLVNEVVWFCSQMVGRLLLYILIQLAVCSVYTTHIPCIYVCILPLGGYMSHPPVDRTGEFASIFWFASISISHCCCATVFWKDPGKRMDHRWLQTCCD